MSILSKPVVQVYIPGNPGSPGSPGQPYLPARSVRETKTVCTWVATDPIAAAAAQGITYTFDFRGAKNADGVPIKTWGYNFPTGVNGFGYENFSYKCAPVTTLVHYPAQNYIPPSAPVPATAAQFFQDFRLGWNARADSVKGLAGPGGYSFRAPVGLVGAVVGLAAAPQASGIGDVLFGFYLSHGVGRLYEAGAEVQYFGTYSSADVFKVKRRGERIVYYRNNQVLRETAAPAGHLRLTAALFSGGDQVEAAALLSGSEAVGAMRPMVGLAGHAGATGAVARGSMLAMTGLARTGDSAHGRMRPMAGIAGKRYAIARGRMIAPRGAAEGMASAPAYALASGAMAYPMSVASGMTGEIGGAVGGLRPMTGLCGRKPYGAVSGAMQAPTGLALTSEAADHATVFSRLFSGAELDSILQLYVVMRSDIEASSILVAQTLLDAVLHSAVRVLDTLTVHQVIHALLTSAARVSTLQFDDAAGLATWVMNTKTAGTTRYEGYGFNSFANVGGRYFGAKAGGIYELVGEDDAGTPVPARINFGNSNFGTPQLKGITEVYVGASSTAGVVVKVIAGGQTYLYNARSSSELLATHRVDLGRGLCENYFELELMSSDGGPLELASIEFTPVPFTRRI